MPSEEICSQTEATLLEKIKTKIPRYLYFESAEHQSERLERVEECSDLLLEEKEKEFTLEILSEGGYESFDEDDCQHDCISLNEDSSDSSPHAPSNFKNEPESDDFISISQPENSDELPGKNFFPSYSSF
ncbi:hypothetical protein TUBRATIS_18340 [Tubulinosema ratisbonensis]|uniref:Uncharacterized protein n=1 Tax=Tubulinosema ratisbonensis TaxID=291195 RepID=A0A437AKI6_9MICR|nr:hypothetical protein TUBRATIS_18340 [Tubulinosema ratisbonensis]